MKHLLASVCFSALALVEAVSGTAVQAASGGNIAFSDIDRYISERMGSARIPGLAVAIVQGDRIVYLKGYGVADPSGRRVTAHTPFLIGSITKSFTALSTMQLVEAGKVDLDAPVQRYVPWFRVVDQQASARITVRHLLTMTSGLPQIYETQLWTAQDAGAIERAVRLLRAAELSGPVGSFGYSNANYEALGVLVQIVSGLSYEDYVNTRIFAPLGMHESFVSAEEARRHGMATGHRWWFGIPIACTLPYNRAELPAGYIASSAEDMSHFLIAQLNGGRYAQASVLSPDGIATTHHAPNPGTYAMGWESLASNGRRLINHDGGTANFQSSVFLDPDARAGVFIAANIMNGLDAFSSPSGSSPLDGPTVRAMAQSVLTMVTNQPMPSQGRGHRRLTVAFDLAIAASSGALLIALAHLPRWRRRLVQRGIGSWPRLMTHVGATAITSLLVPAALWYLALDVPAWKALVVLFEPDLAYWLYAVGTVLLVKGLFELAWVWRAFSQTRIA